MNIPKRLYGKYREGTAAQLAAENPVLFKDEIARETDTDVLKKGNGVTAYTSLRRCDGFEWHPTDYGVKACNFRPTHIVIGIAVAAANTVRTKLWVPENTAINNVHFFCTVAGATVANLYVAIEEISGTNGTRSGVSAAQSGAFAAGLKTIALSSPVAAQTAGRWVYVVYKVQSGSPVPALGIASSGSLLLGGVGQSAATYDSSFIADGAPTTAPPAGPNSLTSASPYYPLWVGIS